MQSVREKITSAGACKERGNAAFAQSDFTGALRHYHEALLYVKGLDTGAGGNAMAAMAMGQSTSQPSSDEAAETRAVLVAVRANMAQALLKLGKHERALAECNAVLLVEPKHQKALYRRSQAHLALKNYDAAKRDLEQLQKEYGDGDANVARSLRVIAQWEKAQEEKEKRVYANMFAK